MFDINSAADPVHVVVEVTSIAVVVWGILHQDRKERNKESRANEERRNELLRKQEEKQEERHAENKESLDDLKIQLEYHPPHRHVERDGEPLTSRGIQYGPRLPKRRDDS